MIGSNGPRMLAAALPHVSSWNTWYVDYGNTAEGFAALNARISEAAERAGRDPAEIERSACAHVVLDPANPERELEVPPIDGADVAARVRELGEAGADEVIIVAGPITERSIRALGDALATSGS
jgi:alkanesulfonate monooxygenase SsuD/methylene tetrahydromethanopterin reductase-like flavin-dependent oxidoreductase (luciferase family)